MAAASGPPLLASEPPSRGPVRQGSQAYGDRVALGWAAGAGLRGENLVSLSPLGRPALPLLSVCWLMVWVKAQTDIYLAGLPGWVKWGWVVLMRFNNNWLWGGSLPEMCSPIGCSRKEQPCCSGGEGTGPSPTSAGAERWVDV